jgi:hypothetical protein
MIEKLMARFWTPGKLIIAFGSVYVGEGFRS